MQSLRALGQPAEALPLIEIAPLLDGTPVRACWQRLSVYTLVMFVSANAVIQFFGQRPQGAVWPQNLRAAATGPGTAAALRDEGLAEATLVQPPTTAPRFDSEALWACLAAENWVGSQVLIVRGELGRDWLAETLRTHGAAVELITAYRRLAPRLGAFEAAMLTAALAAPADWLWHFTSSEAIANLQLLAPDADWSQSAALASHPRIAATARTAGFGSVMLVAPAPDAVVAAAVAWPR